MSSLPNREHPDRGQLRRNDLRRLWQNFVLARLVSLKGHELIACLIISAVAGFIMLPVFARGLPNGYDAFVHYRWSTQFNEALREPGVIYPRWLGGGNNGLGSPVMLYYPPLQFYFTAAFNYLTRDTAVGRALSCWAALALSGLAMYVRKNCIQSQSAGSLPGVRRPKKKNGETARTVGPVQ
jgi:hypothetical protein